jgi:hypothetical protein
LVPSLVKRTRSSSSGVATAHNASLRASYQMTAMYANVHAGGDPVGLQKLGQLTLSGAHLLVHGSAYQIGLL